MKSEHRHELKTNILADWLANSPQWAQQNIRTIIYVIVVIVLVIGAYIWQNYQRNIVEAKKEIQFTSVLSGLSYSKLQILEAQSQGRDISYTLLQPAKDLEVAAQNTKNNYMAALALIKRAEVLRLDLRTRPGAIDETDIAAEINKAKDNYTQAAAKAVGNPTLLAKAKLGIALCEEELGNFQKASEIYSEIIADKSLDATTAAAAAKIRINTLPDYQTKIVFQPAPVFETPVAQEPASGPQIQLQPADANAK